MAALLLAIASGAGAASGRSERLKCAGLRKRDRGACLAKARAACDATFEAALPGCFKPGSGCVRDCLDAEKRCRQEPALEGEGCRLACASDLKVLLRTCKAEVDQQACRTTVRTKAMKCRHQCQLRAGPALQACTDAMNACLERCAGEE